MYILTYSSRFKKDLKKISGNPAFDIASFSLITDALLEGGLLGKRYRNHKLLGEFNGCYECHVHPDVLLIYQVDEKLQIVYLLRIGSHSDLF